MFVGLCLCVCVWCLCIYVSVHLCICVLSVSIYTYKAGGPTRSDSQRVGLKHRNIRGRTLFVQFRSLSK